MIVTAHRWRPTRLVTEDPSKLARAVVEETTGGWIWTVTKGSKIELSRTPTSKAEAIAAAEMALKAGG